jgi:hypothetical protein
MNEALEKARQEMQEIKDMFKNDPAYIAELETNKYLNDFNDAL